MWSIEKHYAVSVVVTGTSAFADDDTGEAVAEIILRDGTLQLQPQKP